MTTIPIPTLFSEDDDEFEERTFYEWVVDVAMIPAAVFALTAFFAMIGLGCVWAILKIATGIWQML